MAAVQTTLAATIGDPVATAALTAFTVSRERASGSLEVEAGGGVEPGKPGGAADGRAGEGVIGV
jgi:hypothetical protein